MFLFSIFEIFLIVKFEGPHHGRQQLESSDRRLVCLLLSAECVPALPDKLQTAGGVRPLLQQAEQTELTGPVQQQHHQSGTPGTPQITTKFQLSLFVFY